MKTYVKPTIEFIELKPEERLACVSGGSTCGGCCSGTSTDYGDFWKWLFGSSPFGICNIPKPGSNKKKNKKKGHH